MWSNAQRTTTLLVLLLIVCAFLAGMVISNQRTKLAERALEKVKMQRVRAEGNDRESRVFAYPVIIGPHGSVDHGILSPYVRVTDESTKKDALIFQCDDPEMPIRKAMESIDVRGFTEP